MLNFRKFDVKDKDLVQSYTLKAEFGVCDLAFANLFVWKFLYNTHIAEYQGFLYIKYWYRESPFYVLPIGNGDFKEAINNVIEYSRVDNRNLRIRGIGKNMIEKIETLFPNYFAFTSKRDYSDYLYLREDLANLSGRKYQPKRNHINQFKRNYPDYKFVEITPEIIPQCFNLECVWKTQNDNLQEKTALDAEREAIKTAFENYDELGLKGGALIVDNQVVAFTYGSPINDVVFDVAVEKADANFTGAYSMINNEFAKQIPENFMFLNREEDLGLEGLRKAKLSYHPVEILDKYTAVELGNMR